jgi:hypothetical protein
MNSKGGLMSINWFEMQKELYPIKDYEDLARRWVEARAYAFVRKAYDFSLAEIEDYTLRLLGGDTHGRYKEYIEYLTGGYRALAAAGVLGIWDLCARVGTRDAFAAFVTQKELSPAEVIGGLKFLVYWVIPMKKPVRELGKTNLQVIEAAACLRQHGIRFNLDLLDRGLTPEGRRALAVENGLPDAVILDLVNRADFSRMPWASSATVSNIIGAGYGSLQKLAAADLEQLSADFYRYGASIGKNLKFGNEIDNSWRIAKIVPPVVIA